MIYKDIMKKIVLVFLLFFSLQLVVVSDNNIIDTWKLPYCTNNECGYQSWVSNVKNMVDNVETWVSLSQYIQNVIIYLLTFLSIVAVIYIIYAWFRILVWGWNDDAMKNARKTILHVVIWIIIIWLAYSIVAFVLNILNSSSTVVP